MLLRLSQAAELALKFLSSDKAVQVVEVIGPRLIEISKFSPVSALTLGQTVFHSIVVTHNYVSPCCIFISNLSLCSLMITLVYTVC